MIDRALLDRAPGMTLRQLSEQINAQRELEYKLRLGVQKHGHWSGRKFKKRRSRKS